MKRPIKVHLFGAEENGWALDTDLALTRESLLRLPSLIELTPLAEAEVVHAVWEEPLFALDQELLVGKRIICHACNDLLRLYENPLMIRARDTIGLWVGMSRAAMADLAALNHPSFFVPYSVDTAVFTPVTADPSDKTRLRSCYGLAKEAFIISNFMRDSFGHNLQLAKDQKGAEVLLEAGRRLKARGIPLHFLLAGPRRHWLRGKLQENNLDYTYIGEIVEDDDLPINIKPPDCIRDLYHASDLHLISSRWEGGPRSVLEAAATKTAILSTPVGAAPDILDEACLYGAIDELVEKIQTHYETGYLQKSLEKNYARIITSHTAVANAGCFQDLYQNIEKVAPYEAVRKWVAKPSPPPTLLEKLEDLAGKITGKKKASRKLTISLWHTFHKPPYGGGNQFMMALQKAMLRQGVKVVTNKMSAKVDVHICNSCWFDHKKFDSKAGRFPVRMIHRIDGPVTLYRGEGRDEDERIFELNKAFASATVFQSAYSFKKSYELGFTAISPVIISNGVNDEIFSAKKGTDRGKNEKVRLISSAWSDNPRKGGPFLKWLDQQLDWDRFEYSFVGRVKEEFTNIHHIDAVASNELASLLQEHDIFISASQHEPCSNALLEALSCGLPALYRDDGGNAELVSFGGLPFKDEKDVLDQLDRLVNELDSFQNLISLRSIDDIADKYIKLAEKLCDWQA